MTRSIMLLVACVGLAACGPDFLDQDTDADGIVNSSDLCPTVDESINEFKDDDGCPDEVPAEEVPPLDLDVVGTWQGSLTVQPTNRDPRTYFSAVVIIGNVRQRDALVTLPCIWNGTVVRPRVDGSARTLTISGANACPFGGPATCQSRFIYETGTVVVDAARRMSLSATGVYEDCAGASPATFTMTNVEAL